MNRNCSACNIKIDINNYKKDRTVCKSCYNKNKKKKNNNNTIIPLQQTKFEIDNNNTDGTLIIGFSKCGKTYLRNHIVHQKQEPIFEITKSLNQYPNINAQSSDETEPSENYEKSTVVLTICYYQNKKTILIRFLLEGVTILLIYSTYLKFIFIHQKKTIRNISNTNLLFKQTLRDIILLFHDIAGLDMILEEWK